MNIEDGILYKLNFTEMRSDATIRLSDYCHTIDNDAVFISKFFATSYKLTVLLDDKVEFDRIDVISFGDDSIVFDLSELKSQTLAERFYNSMLARLNGIFECLNVIDIDNRNLRYLALHIINSDFVFRVNDYHELNSHVGTKNFAYMHDFLVRKYAKSFKELSEMELGVKLEFIEKLSGLHSSLEHRVALSELSSSIKSFDDGLFKSNPSVDDVRTYTSLKGENFLLDYFDVPVDDIRRLNRFMTFFATEKDTKILSYWVDLQKRMIKQLFGVAETVSRSYTANCISLCHTIKGVSIDRINNITDIGVVAPSLYTSPQKG